MNKKLGILLLLVLGTFLYTFGDGYILPDPKIKRFPLRHLTLNYHRVNVRIEDQLVTTRVEEEFHNPNRKIFEGVYFFPVPKGAVIRNFFIYENGKKLKGELLKASEAKRIYQSIVRKMKDPGLLEWYNSSTYMIKIYPVPALQNKKIVVEYSEMINNENGLLKYNYPLKIENLSRQRIGQVSIKCEIRSKEAIKNIYSPTHDISISERTEHLAVVTFEQNNMQPDKDFTLYYSVSPDDVGINLITYKKNGEDGYFAALFAPKIKIDKKEIASKNIIFIFDRSGSMSGKKIVQAKAGLKFCMEHLNKNDNFNIIAFSDHQEKFSKTIVRTSQKNISRAIDFIKEFDANGGTDIYSSLETGLSYMKGKSQNYIIFLTDGLPTVGVRNTQTILKMVKNKNNSSTKIFVWGVGYDVNTHFLDKLANNNQGFSQYVEPQEDIEIKVSNFYSKIQNPFLVNIAFKINGIDVYDIFPKDLPDLFAGSQLVVFGRYKNGGKAIMQLNGSLNNKKVTFKQSVDFSANYQSNEMISYIWASRKIGYLTEQVRLNRNKELIDEIIRLSKKYGILTEYTSFIARADAIGETTNDYKKKFHSLATPAMAEQEGKYAVKQSKKIGGLKKAKSVRANSYYNRTGEKVVVNNLRNAKQQSFVNNNGVWNSLDMKKKEAAFMTIQTFSDAYFNLIEKYPKIQKYIALGNNVIFRFNNRLIEINENKGLTKLSGKKLEQLGK